MYRANFNILLLFLTFTSSLMAQTSPLAKGKWAKIAVNKQGIFKLTGVQIRALGFSLPIASTQIQLFSHYSSLQSEKVPANPKLGLFENAIKVNDGGDGQIDASDDLLFYASGPVQWNDSVTQNGAARFARTVNDSVFYFLTIGNNGKRIGAQNVQSNLFVDRTLFTQRVLFEKDSISFLNSGKIFWDLPMGTGAGKQAELNFSVNTNGMNSASKIDCFTQLASTSYTSNGRFDFYWNDQLSQTRLLQPVSGMLFDDIASTVIDSFTSPKLVSWPSKSTLKVSYTSSSANATGWIDYVALKLQKPIGFWQDTSMSFSIETDFIKGQIANCKIQDIDASAIIWNVTNVEDPLQISWQLGPNNTGSFLQKTDAIANYFAVKNNAFESPILLGAISNQDLINISGEVNYIIVAAPAYMEQAKRYQQFQISQFGRKTMVVNASHIYNDYAGGQPTAMAIRNFLKHVKNTAVSNNYKTPEYLLLLGMGNFNPRKMNLDYELPVYENNNSTSILASFSTDDFFSILSDGDDINNYNAIQNLSMAVGRIPARTIAEADTAIAKLIAYQSNKLGGEWENKITWIADDGDYNLHLQDAEGIVANLKAKAPSWNHEKIYLDLFPALASTSGNSFPLANNFLQQSVQEGSLLINYTGHGNYLRLSEEGVISQTQLDGWNNRNKLPLLVTASCNFAPYDQPGVNAIAWDAFMKNGKGVIGLVAANRLVFAYSNRQINDLFIQQLLVADAAGKRKGIGLALQAAKNINWAQGGDRVNDFKFSVIGDPALVLSMPNAQIELQTINDKLFISKDTLLSGSNYTLKGTVVDAGIYQSDFNGILTLTIYDAVKNKNTLGNQTTSMVVPIEMQSQVLFKGKFTITKGLFNANFILPIQVANTNAPVRIVIAATSTTHSAIRVLDSIFVKPNNVLNVKDTLGPEINAYLNEPNFKQGEWTTSNAQLYIQLKDSAGIQTSGNALGQDLVVFIDDNPIPIVMNNYFIADIDRYTSGVANIALPSLAIGKHVLIIKAWDLLGNGSKDSLTFEVPPTKQVLYKRPFNYPNPIQTQGRFGFETNQLGKSLTITLDILNQSGLVQYTNTAKVENSSTKYYVDWDGKTNMGALLTPGVYYYRFTIQSNLGTSILSNSFIKL